MVNLFKEIKDEIISFDRYTNRNLVGIQRNHNRVISWYANDRLTYGEWVNNLPNLASVKVEGLENNKKLIDYFKSFKVKDIHLFYNPRTSYSFNWHKDTVDVFLYVVRGSKIVKIKNKTYTLFPGNGVIIPKGHIHKVLSKRDTWALSIGYERSVSIPKNN